MRLLDMRRKKNMIQKNKFKLLLTVVTIILIVVLLKPSVKTKGFNDQTVNVSASLPSIATSTGIGATNGNASIYGNSTYMIVSVTTGNAPVANKVIATTTVGYSCPNYVVPNFSAGNINSMILASTSQVYMGTSSISSFTINSGAAALAATTTYVWDVFTGCN